MGRCDAKETKRRTGKLRAGRLGGAALVAMWKRESDGYFLVRHFSVLYSSHSRGN